MNTILSRIEKDGAAKLALRLSSGAVKGSGSALAAAMSEEGFLVPSGVARAVIWKFDGIAQDGEGVFLFGPSFEGLSLDDAGGIRDGMPLLFIVARALASLASEGKLPRSLVSSGVLVSTAKDADGSGSVLILPPAAVAKALSARGPEARAAAASRLASPLSKGPGADASFVLAQAAYRIATGKSAFDREAAEPGSLAGTRRYSTAAELAAPRLDRSLAALIDKALDDPNRVGLGDWVEALGGAASAWERKLSADEEAELGRRRVSVESEKAKALKRDAFFRKRGGLLVVVAVALLLVGFAVADFARAQRGKPDYSALPPLEVARQYYAAIDGLDLDSLEACGERDAIKADRNVLLNLIVLTRTRMAYEGRNPLLPARDWIASGKRALKETDFLYGIAGLEIAADSAGSRDGSGAGVVRFRASYSLWSLERIDAPSGDPGKVGSEPTEEKRVDELVLRQGRKGWRIAGIDRRHP